MSSIQLTHELRAFVKDRFSSADQIGIVLLLLQDPERSWTTSEVADRLKMAPESTAMRLFLLASAGLIAFEPAGVPRYRYAATDETTDRLLHELVPVFAGNTEEVLRIIAAAEVDPIRTFADAFKLKG